MTARDKITKRRRGKKGVKWGRGSGAHSTGGRAVHGYLCRGPRVAGYATAGGARQPAWPEPV